MLNLYVLYRLAERLYTGFSRHLPGGYALPPLQMVIELTYRCNLKCDFCFQRRQMEQMHVRPGGPTQELDLKTQESAIGRLRNALNTAKSNKEYSAILAQINSDKADTVPS